MCSIQLCQQEHNNNSYHYGYFAGVLQPSCTPGIPEANEDTIVAIISDFQSISVSFYIINYSEIHQLHIFH